MIERFPPRADAELVAGPDGTALVRTDGRGTTCVSILAQGWAPRMAALRAQEPGPAPAVVVTLAAAARVEGRVTGAPAGAVARAVCPPYALQQADHRNTLLGPEVSFEAPVDGSGSFTLDPLPVGARLHLQLVTAGGEVLLEDPVLVTLSAGEVRQLGWTLGAGTTLRCLVRERTGATREGVGVWLLSTAAGRPGLAESHWTPRARSTTGPDGLATIPDVPPGRWIVALEPQRRRGAGPDAYPATAMAVDVGTEDAYAELTLVRGLYVSGRVVDPTGAGHGAGVTYLGPKGFLSTTARGTGPSRWGRSRRAGRPSTTSQRPDTSSRPGPRTA